MSRIGKQVIEIPSGVEIKINDGLVMVKGSKGTLEHKLPEMITVKVEDNLLSTSVQDEENNEQRTHWGTHTSHLANMVKGVSEGYKKELEINGVGFKVALQGKKLNLNLGFSHSVEFPIPDGVTAEVEKNRITISGIDKQAVGHVAAQIRALKKPEPYKGKGIKYVDEVIRRKAGKAAASGE